ncbi:MAG: glycoside hydrolase family 13 protein, partial [Clostridia bacterium]
LRKDGAEGEIREELKNISTCGGNKTGENLKSVLACGGNQTGENLKSVSASVDSEIFEGSFKLYESGIWFYRFEGMFADGSFAFFGRGEDGIALRGDWLPEWQLTVTKCDYKTPIWAKQGLIYHIFADRFCKDEHRHFDKLNATLHTNWNDRPDVPAEGVDYRADDFFGGNIKGIISKLGYLKSLNVTCIYLSPIFEASSNHRYDTGDYMKIDSLFGDEAQFAQLIDQAKSLGINVMLDGVFNHTGADSIYFNKFGHYNSVGAFQSKTSPYHNWYYFNKFPSDYHCWWGSTVVPTVNKSSKGFRELILGKNGVIEKWTKLGVRGWRLDVVDELPIDFTNDLCKKIKSVSADTLIVGEVWEDATTKESYGELRPYFMGEQLDSVMNYPFKDAINNYVLNGNVKDFEVAVIKILENYPKESLDTLMNIIDSHDTVRALTYFADVALPPTIALRSAATLLGKDLELAKRRLKLASILQFTLPGVPCVYYGDEAGMQGYEDPMNRATYPWGKEDNELLSHYRALGDFRKNFCNMLNGETYFVDDKELLIFERISQFGKLTIYVNNTDHIVKRENVVGINAFDNTKICGLKLASCSATIVFKL